MEKNEKKSLNRKLKLNERRPAVIQKEQSDHLQSNNVGYWNTDEHQKYIVFAKFFKRQLNTASLRRDGKIFKIMAKFLQSRSHIQCRSHHIKMLRSYRNIQQVVKKYKQKIGGKPFDKLFKQITTSHRIFDESSSDYNLALQGIVMKDKTHQAVQTDLSSFANPEIFDGGFQHQDITQNRMNNYQMMMVPNPYIWHFIPQ